MFGQNFEMEVVILQYLGCTTPKGNVPLNQCGLAETTKAAYLKQSMSTAVVYFDQRTHACACVRMVENDKKHSKIIKKSYTSVKITPILQR